LKASNASTSSSVPITACPVEQAIHFIGGKWKLLLLRSLLLNGPQRYNELLASVTGISAKELTRNLGELSVSGLVTSGPQYTLTQLGKGLMPTFKSLLIWGKSVVGMGRAASGALRSRDGMKAISRW
jgi:DNA-binding HxlR family transcriptional regulator